MDFVLAVGTAIFFPNNIHINMFRPQSQSSCEGFIILPVRLLHSSTWSIDRIVRVGGYHIMATLVGDHRVSLESDDPVIRLLVPDFVIVDLRRRAHTSLSLSFRDTRGGHRDVLDRRR
jgi:hypothetical protein